MSAQQLITEHIDLWTSAIKARKTQGRGSNKKRELYGIKKLRELILELAVRGKLVRQDPSDEPASVLLERIAAEKAQLIKGKKIKKQKALPEITDEDKPFELPEGWAGAYLDSISDINGGFAFKSSQYIENGIRVIRISDFDEKGFKDDKVVRHQYSDLLRQYVLEENNILMAMTGGTVGKCFLVDHLREKMVVNQRVATIKISSKISPVFLSCVLQSSMAKNVIHEAKNSTNDNISMSQIKGFFIPVPALAEQHRIVAKVDELMALCDQLEQQTESSLDAHKLLLDTLLSTLTDARDATELSDNWARLADHFDTLITTDYAVEQLKQTILQLAVMGKLVPQNPNDEPASELLKRIAAEKEQLDKDKNIKKQKRLLEVKSEEETFGLPNGWEWCKLKNLITLMDAGWSPACPPEPSPSDNIWGVLKTTAVQAMEYRQHENKVLSSNKEPKPQFEVRVGDILITRAGPKNRVGISCLVQTTRPKLMISDKIIRFHLVEVGMYERYVSLCLNAGATAKYLEAEKSGMAESQMNISQDKLKTAPIPLCPINEQHRIVAKVDELMILCDQLKAQLNNAQTTQLHLSDAVVESALTA